MPAYVYNCAACSESQTLVRKVADRDHPISCDCGSPMQRIQVYPVRLGGVNFRAYKSPATGRVIDSPTKERDELARTGCFIDEAGVDKQIRRRRRELEAESEKVVDHLVEKTYGELSACGKGI